MIVRYNNLIVFFKKKYDNYIIVDKVIDGSAL
jgi:hypothetical protein